MSTILLVEDDENLLRIISYFLSQSGFHDIQRCKFQEGSVPDMDILDNRPDETLFVEARK